MKKGTSLIPGSGDLQDDLKAVTPKMIKHFAQDAEEIDNGKMKDIVMKEFDKIIGQFVDIKDNEKLAFTNDADLSLVPQNCEAVQVLIYQNDGTILRDRNYWDKLDSLNKAAFVVHEWIYKRARDYGAKKSDESRSAVANIFSSQTVPVFQPIWGVKDRVLCLAGNSNKEDEEIFELIAIESNRDGKSGLELFFVSFKDILTTSRTTSFLEGMTYEILLSNDFLTDSILRTHPIRLEAPTRFAWRHPPNSYLDTHPIRGGCIRSSA